MFMVILLMVVYKINKILILVIEGKTYSAVDSLIHGEHDNSVLHCVHKLQPFM